jgi:glycine dehydrogenase subunit 1
MRYLPHTDDDRADMLAVIGAEHIDALFSDIPAAKLLREPVHLPAHKSELEVSRTLRAIAKRNQAAGDGRSLSARAPTVTMCRRAWITSSSARNS